MEINGRVVQHIGARIYIPTNHIAFAVYEFNKLLIPRMDRVADFLVNRVLKQFAEYVYQELYKCDSPIKMTAGTFKRDNTGKVIFEEARINVRLSWETFWYNNVHIAIISNGQNPILIGTTDNNKQVVFERFHVPPPIDETYTFGSEIIITGKKSGRYSSQLFYCDGRLGNGYRTDGNWRFFVSRFLHWENAEDGKFYRYRTGLQISIVFYPNIPGSGFGVVRGPIQENNLPVQSCVFAIYNPYIDIENVLFKLFNDALSSVMGYLPLTQAHFGYNQDTGLSFVINDCEFQSPIGT